MIENGNAGGSLNPNDLATLSLLYGGGGRYGGGPGVGMGGGYPGSGYLTAEAISNGTAVKEAIDGNAKMGSRGMDNIADRFEDATRADNFSRVCERIVELSADLSRNQLFNAEKINDVRAETAKCCCDTQKAIAECCCDTQKSIAQAAKEAALCCCDAKLQACKDHADLRALIIQENSATRELMRGDALAAANAKIVQLETINALSSNGHHH